LFREVTKKGGQDSKKGEESDREKETEVAEEKRK